VKVAASRAFCTTLNSLVKVMPPIATNFSNYKEWIAVCLPYFQKLATEAPGRQRTPQWISGTDAVRNDDRERTGVRVLCRPALEAMV
jgi:hypothetical protein